MTAETDAMCPDTLPPLLVDRHGAARLLGMSSRSLDRLREEGGLPAPLTLTRRPLWRVAELTAWIDAGAPPRVDWERMRTAR